MHDAEFLHTVNIIQRLFKKLDDADIEKAA